MKMDRKSEEAPQNEYTQMLNKDIKSCSTFFVVR